jgi:hypothetical protein
MITQQTHPGRDACPKPEAPPPTAAGNPFSVICRYVFSDRCAANPIRVRKVPKQQQGWSER